METNLPSPMTARVYVNLPEGNIHNPCNYHLEQVGTSIAADSLSTADWLENAMGEPSSSFPLANFHRKIMVEIVENPGLHILYPLVMTNIAMENWFIYRWFNYQKW